MKSSGERYDSGLNAAQISYEHWHRYLYVSQFIKGKEVLDIACGEGYGANLLARTAACVTGVDLSEEAVAFASRTYQKNNLQFLRGSVEKIPIDGAGRFDVVVSFETIEHVDAAAQQKFCLEVKRLLKDDGVFIVSSPNKLLYSDTLGHKNEFHRKELYEREFVDLLKKNYTHVALLGQRPLTGSNIWEMSPGRQRNVFTEYEIANKDDRYVPVNGGKQPLYFIALCSQGEIEVPGDSFLGDNALSILTERDEQIAVLRHQAAECDARLGALADELCGVYASKKWKALMRVAPLIGWLKALGTRTPKQAAHWPVQLKSWWKVFLLERRRAGGIPQTAKKAWNMLKRQGWSGVWNGMIYFKARVMRGERILSALERNHYPEWIRRFDTLTEEDRSKLCAVTETLRVKPLISVVMPLYNAKPQWLKEAIESVRRQLYPRWELCIADDASTDPSLRPILERAAKEDPRIKISFRKTNGNIAAASNSALEIASGEWVALLDHDDLLAQHALLWVADTINRDPGARLIYSDEDKIDGSGRRFDPYFKCDWNEDLFYSHNLISHLGVYQTALVREVGGFRTGYEGSQDYDLVLRCIERIRPGQIRHIPHILYHWRAHSASTAQVAAVKPYAYRAAAKAIEEHFERCKIKASAEVLDCGMYRVRYALPETLPLVSLIILTRNRRALLQKCVESILKKTTYTNYEILIVDNGSDDPATLRYLKELESRPNIRLLRDDRPFNFSALNNAAVKVARGRLVGLLNNDLEVLSPQWLSEMVSHALRPEVGAVGARLWYPDKTLQHGGVVLGVGGVAGHAHKHLLRHRHGYIGRASLLQSFSAVTGACLVIRKPVYEQIGGFDEENLKVAFNDIDFCLRLVKAGYRNVWTPYAELHHLESATRGVEDTPQKRARFASEVQYMKRTWGAQLLNDPSYSPNLTLEHEDFSLAWPPRVGFLPEASERGPEQLVLKKRHASDILDAYAATAPDAQAMLDIFSGEWSSALPAGKHLVTAPGSAALFEDPRIDWAAARLGGFEAKTCLELGPLEGGHSYMMQRMGAKKVIAVEANRRAFLKCLCIKEVFELSRVEFRYGDFRRFLEDNSDRYDILLASGVLYHMLDPLELIRQICRASDRIFIWTHYYDGRVIESRPELCAKFGKLENIDKDGVRYEWVEYTYGRALDWQGFCGGSTPTCRWLTRESILTGLKAQGFNRLDIGFEASDHPNGPSFAVAAQRA